MANLSDLPLEDPPGLVSARKSGGVVLGMALARGGCSVEAAFILRPLQKDWSKGDEAALGKAALKAVAWWNKHWRDFARAMHADQFDKAQDILGDRAATLWDQPALVAHLGRLHRVAGNTALARHLFARLEYLSQRGVPKIDMGAFAYVAAAGLIDVLCDEQAYDAALEAYGAIAPNLGNIMAHQIQGARLLALADRSDDAMRALAELLITAEQRKKGWSGQIRRDFVNTAPELQALRSRPDWEGLLKAPAEYLGQAR